ncbi:tetratricopeptide repeat protein [Stappia sp.]|uniref:tetratricopeptide repeat protein n=1 Tax=Stappia sp. TaxID=1870903 RepID=UPI003A9A4167
MRLGRNAARVLAQAAVLVALVPVPGSGAHAQSAGPAAVDAIASRSDAVSRADLQARQSELLGVMLRDPSNLDIAFEYATVSAALGDYEAAIGTFERMLIYAPGLPRIQLELGVLYFRLGSFDAARSYFQSALQADNVPPEVAERVNTFLTAIDTAENPAKFTATVMTGIRWQSNANAGPGGRQVTLNGLPFLLDDTAIGRPDWNVFIAGNAHFAYDLGNQGDLLEADLLFYGGRYFDATRLDTELAELTFGPSFNLARFNIDNARIGFYGIAGGVRLDDANYSGALGFGTRFAIQPDSRTALTSKLEYRRRWYRDTATYPTVSNRDGYQIAGQTTYAYAFDRNWSFRGFVMGDYEQAAAHFEESWELGAGIGATYRFASPVAALSGAWSLDAETGYIRREYRAPDPSVNPSSAETDNEFWLRGGLTVPIRSDIAVALTTEFRRLQSNYPTRDYSNTSVMMSVVKAF